jgi:hypothetical protein
MSSINSVRILSVLLLCLSCSSSFAQSLTADEIMARVAANQDAAIQMRTHYIYRQHVHSTSHQTNGKLMREETADYDIFPTPTGTERKLSALQGRYWKKRQYLEYNSAPVPDAESIDAAITHDLLDEENNQREGKEGAMSNLFPLTSRKQQDYKFKLLGEESAHGRPAYHLSFEPRDKNDIEFSGEAFIDKEEFQPVHVFTKLNRKLPFLVRGVMGVDLPGIGFNVQYFRQEPGVWFPETFGTEFGLNIFHFYKRNITISLKNSDFRKTHVDSTITLPSPGE